MDRRQFLTVLAAGTAAALAGCSEAISAHTPARTSGTPSPARPQVPTSIPSAVKPDAMAGVTRLPAVAAPAGGGRIAAPGIVEHLTSANSDTRFALTVDDGVSADVVDAYVDFVIASGIRMTFFVNGVYDSWTAVRAKLAPLVDSGQVQLGNHTWSHPSVTGLPDRDVEDQITHNERFLTRTYGVSGRPYFRPPYGNHDARTDGITTSLGYANVVMWDGSLGDSAILSPAQVLANARQWCTPGRVVIGHANHPAVTYIYPQLVELIRARRLQTVTLNDVFTAAD